MAEAACAESKRVFANNPNDAPSMQAHYNCVVDFCKNHGPGTNWTVIIVSIIAILCCIGVVVFAVLKGFKATDVNTEGGDEDFKRADDELTLN